MSNLSEDILNEFKTSIGHLVSFSSDKDNWHKVGKDLWDPMNRPEYSLSIGEYNISFWIAFLPTMQIAKFLYIKNKNNIVDEMDCDILAIEFNFKDNYNLVKVNDNEYILYDITYSPY